jgi:hypothetical protein
MHSWITPVKLVVLRLTFEVGPESTVCGGELMGWMSLLYERWVEIFNIGDDRRDAALWF